MTKFASWDLCENIEKYVTYERECHDRTPYHSAEYLQAEEKAEEGKVKVFVYERDGKFAIYTGVVRLINALPYVRDLEDKYYDLITPHEYGGIISNTTNIELKEELLRKLSQYCNENNIIYHFARINPYLDDLPAIYKKENYELVHSCSQVYVNLDQTENEIFFGYKSNVRRNVKRAEKEGLTFEIAEKNKDNTKEFQSLYQSAMEVLGAKKFLYFNEKYFRSLITCSCSRLGVVRDVDNKIIAASIMLLGEETIYYHLGCFNREYAFKRPMNYLIHSMILWGRQNGYKTFHLAGGGRSLMQFKEGYASTRIDYYIAYRVCNENQYRKICEDWREQFPQYANATYYPLYRYNE